jgi:hypothetical protein
VYLNVAEVAVGPVGLGVAGEAYRCVCVCVCVCVCICVCICVCVCICACIFEIVYALVSPVSV